MKVRMLVSRCGPEINDYAGDIVEVGDAEGGRMIAAGQAVPYTAPAKRKKSAETATKKEAVETADA